jgi:peptide/nickel transport system ATP-binding protein
VGPARDSRCYLHDATASLPRNTPVEVDLVSARDATEQVVTLQNLSKTFTHSGESVRALVDVNISLERGETLGLVGESGSGKTTLARALLGLIAPDEGSVVELDGTSLAAEARRRPRDQLKALQIVFQNPSGG